MRPTPSAGAGPAHKAIDALTQRKNNSNADDWKAWNTAEIVEWAKTKGLDDKAVAILEKEEIKGKHLADLTEEKLERWGMSGGAAIDLNKAIDALTGRRIATTTTSMDIVEKLNAMNFTLTKLSHDVPHVIDGVNVTPSNVSTKQMRALTKAIGMSVWPIGQTASQKAEKYAIQDKAVRQSYRFAFDWSNVAMPDVGDHDNVTDARQLAEQNDRGKAEVASYPVVMKWLEEHKFVVVDVSEGEGMPEGNLFDCAVYTPRTYDETSGSWKNNGIMAKHRLKGRTDLVVLMALLHEDDCVGVTDVKFAIEIKTIGGFNDASFREAYLQVIGLCANNHMTSPPVVLSNLAGKHYVLYLDLTAHKFLVRIRRCTGFGDAIFLADKISSRGCISKHFVRPPTPPTRSE